MPLPDLVIPAPHEEERLRSGYNVVQEYRRRYEEEHAGEPWFEDTKWFKHEPDWRSNTWSVQAAADKKGIWSVVHLVWWMGMLTFGLWPLLRVYLR